MKIATWNVNSLRVRLPQVIEWLTANQPDVLCLQETKLQDADFPVAEFAALGYRVRYSGQRTYNGVATASRQAARDVRIDLPDLDDPQRRVLGVTVGDTRVLNVYIPNGQAIDSPKYPYKLDWLEKLMALLSRELADYPRFVLLGDFNIAPEDRDVYDPEAWRGRVLCSAPERAMFERMLAAGLHDSFRKFEQPEATFSWWDYRAAAFRRNRGLRLDHQLVSAELYARCRGCVVDKAPRQWERPSDHAPVVAEFDGY